MWAIETNQIILKPQISSCFFSPLPFPVQQLAIIQWSYIALKILSWKNHCEVLRNIFIFLDGMVFHSV